ncbi:dtw domain-containing protein 2 [Limosa lapponica baueri]|uniref:Dtw domain-containing protein 2 n=1 Tax=Limosa lapponica baueri TaxID=1758121 RepID=A0A2I0TCF7_LIMLA|nr:dtw domain-containing protein 2 [Limosa lapponica baueri]
MGRRGGVALYMREQLDCMKLCLGMDEELIENLWVRIKGRTSKDIIIALVCYRPLNQVNEALYRQIGEASHLQDLILMGDFNHPNTCWRDSKAGHKQSRRFLECIDDKFLLKVTVEPRRKGSLLHLILTNKEGLIGGVKIRGSLRCSDHKMLDFRILRAWKRVKIKFTTLDFKKAYFGLFKDLLGRVLWDNAPEEKGA